MVKVALKFQCVRSPHPKFSNLDVCQLRKHYAKQGKAEFMSCLDCSGATELPSDQEVFVNNPPSAVKGKTKAQAHSGAKNEPACQGGKKMSNSLTNLHDHLFTQLERLNDSSLKGEELTEEINRAKVVSAVSSQIIANANVILKARLAMDNSLYREDYPEILIGNCKKTGK